MSVGSAPIGTPKASASEWAASVDRTRVRCPARAAVAAVPAAAVVLPTPPLPVKRIVRKSGEALDALLEPFESAVDDDLLRLALDHPDHRDRDVDRERVRHLGAAAAEILELVGAVESLEHLALRQGPAHRLV